MLAMRRLIMVVILMAEKNEFHQKTCFEATTMGLVCLLMKHAAH